MAEAAERYNLDEKTIYRLIRRGDLTGHRIRGMRAIRIKAADLDAVMERIPAAEAGRC